MVVHGPLVRAGEDLQRAVVGVHVVEQDADREHVLVGVRIERPILVPLHRRAVLGGFHVHLAAGAQPDVGADQRFERRHDARIRGEFAVEGVCQMGLLDASDPRRVRGVRGFEIQHGAVFREPGGAGHDVVGDRAQLGERLRQQGTFDNDIAVLVVLRDLRFRQHGVPRAAARLHFVA